MVRRATHQVQLGETLPAPRAVPVDQAVEVPVDEPSGQPEDVAPSLEFEAEGFGDDVFPPDSDGDPYGTCGDCHGALGQGDFGLICPNCYRRWRDFHPFCGGRDCGCPWNFSDELSVFAGVQSFAGPIDLGQNGNFGFHEGMNWAGPLWHRARIGYQMGVRAVHSELSGADVANQRETTRNQLFVTGGLFFRAPCNHGWEFGVVFDWMQDDYYVDPTLQQMRTQLSYLTFCGHELGVWASVAADDYREDEFGNRFQSLDLMGFFYRYTTPHGGHGRFWGGATDDGDGMLGADFRVPLSLSWTFAGGVNYIIPEQGNNSISSSEEAWGISVSMIWHPFRRCRDGSSHRGPYRPMFDVADNNVFIIGHDLR